MNFNIKKVKINLSDCILISLFSAIIAVFSIVSIPTVIPFTLQTLAIFSALSLLGGKRGLIAVLLYICIGVSGVPVFCGFSSGIGHILGATGGYILGFVPLCLTYFLIEKLLGKSLKIKALGLFSGLLVCYLTGTLWYVIVYLKTNDLSSFHTAVATCVLPFLIPDIIKIIAALLISKRFDRIKMFRKS